ncbi:MAG TPA: serine hydrolase [Solirubrobacteraceae bacterium]|nr:serine hydrolase [Solirubrobacteraceae bacterium]
MSRVAAFVAVAAVVLLGAGCGGADTASGPERRAPAVRPPAPPPLQIANGPIEAADPGRPPLRLKLAATEDLIDLRFGRQPRSGLLFDLDTGEVLWRRLPNRVLPIASLTKMMTALVVVQRARPSDKVRVTKEALAYRGSGLGVLPRGKRVKLETMLNGLMLPSGNDAAIALAQRVSGTVARFVVRMNEQARALGLACTRFSSPSGFVDDGNHSCAADLAGLTRAVLDQPRLARIVRRRRAVLPFPIKGGRIFLYNNNPLVRMGYPGTLGVKTGFTRAAGRCLVAAARRNGRRLGVVLLHSPDPARQARVLLNRGFALRR